MRQKIKEVIAVAIDFSSELKTYLQMREKKWTYITMEPKKLITRNIFLNISI